MHAISRQMQDIFLNAFIVFCLIKKGEICDIVLVKVKLYRILSTV